MALTATQMAEAAIKAGRMYTEFEGRTSNFGGLKPFLDGAARMLPQGTVERIKNSSNARDIVFPLLTKQMLTVITARSCTITGAQPNSVQPSITPITRGFEILMYPKVYENNYISEVDAFAHMLERGIASVSPGLDTYAIGLMEAGKNTALATVNLPGVNIVGNAYQIDAAYRERLYFYIRTIMEKNDINSSVLSNIGSTESLDLLLQYESMGGANNQNLAAVLTGDVPSALSNFRHYRSNRLENGTGVAETHYISPFGSMGVFTWNDSDAIARREGGTQKAYTVTDDTLGITWDVAEESICSDLSATYGDAFKRTYGTRYQFAVDFGFFLAYSSDTTKPIIKIEVLNAA